MLPITSRLPPDTVNPPRAVVLPTASKATCPVPARISSDCAPAPVALIGTPANRPVSKNVTLPSAVVITASSPSTVGAPRKDSSTPLSDTVMSPYSVRTPAPAPNDSIAMSTSPRAIVPVPLVSVRSYWPLMPVSSSKTIFPAPAPVDSCVSAVNTTPPDPEKSMVPALVVTFPSKYAALAALTVKVSAAVALATPPGR